MSTFKLVQISDTHLSEQRPQFVGNFEIASDWIADAKPDLVVHSGDIAVEATAREDDLRFSREALDALPVPFRAIPGNHDIGDNPGDNAYVPKKLTNEARLDAYESLFDRSWWQLDAGGWMILGLNAQLFSTGLAAETAQMEWLHGLAETASYRDVAIFCHKPLMRDAVEEPADVPYRYVPLAPRRVLSAIMGKLNVRLYACGHVHQSRDHVVDGVRHVWAPATAFTLPDEVQPAIGTKRCGLVSYAFSPGSVEVEMVYPDGMVMHDYDAVRAAYV